VQLSVAKARGNTLSVTVADYLWWRPWRPAWADGHCVTLVSDIRADCLVRSLGSSPIAKVHGIDALLERTVEHWDRGYDPSQAVIGVADIDGSWALIAEMNGYVGVTERLIGPISTGRTIVSHYRNINAVHRFNWWRAGRLLVDLDLLFPTERFGADPDALLEDVRGVGIPLDAESDDVAGMDLSAAGFALAQRITNVACTPEFFERSDFLVAVVTMPDGEEQQRYGQALRATWHIPTIW
jgi:Family of unknown function (DUF6461)